MLDKDPLLGPIIQKGLATCLISTFYLQDCNHQFRCHLQPLETVFSGSSSTYVYLFSHRPSFTFHEDEWVKADHLHELGFLFGWSYYYESYQMTKEEEEFGKVLREYWTSFALNG